MDTNSSFILPFLLFLSQVDFTVTSSGAGVANEYCQGSSFTPTCGNDEIIAMQSAQYGSIQIGECIKEDSFGWVGCSADVLGVADNLCSGRRTCDIRITNNEMDILRACKDDLSRYLKAAYWCTKVHKPPQQKCTRPASVSVNTKPGYLASIISLETNCGLTEFPWILVAKEGQKVNLTLTNFNWQKKEDANELDCPVKLGYIFDLASENIVNICEGTLRVTHLYLTEGNQLQLLLDKATLQGSQFMIQYEAVGCPLMPLPENTWSEMSGGVITVGCTNGPEKWTLKCRGSHWIGIMQNCPKMKPTEKTVEVKSPKSVNMELPSPEDQKYYFTFIFVIGGITVVGCVVVIVTGLICIKRMNLRATSYKASYEKKPSTDNHSNLFQTLTTQSCPTGGHCEWPNGTMLSNNSGGTEAAQYFILDKDYMDNMYTLQARQ